MVTVLSFVLNFVDEGSDHTVGHVGWHGLAAGGAVSDSLLARSAHDIHRGAAGYRKLLGNVETHPHNFDTLNFEHFN